MRVAFAVPAGLAALLLAGCGLSLRPDPPGPAPWEAFDVPVGEAQDLPDLKGSPLELKEVVRVALARNAGLHAAEAAWEAARARPQQAVSLPDPTLMISGFAEEIVTRNGAIQANLALQQGIPFPTKLSLRGTVAEQEALMAWERYVARGLSVMAEAKKAYFEMYWIGRAVEITEENRQTLQQLIEVAQTKFAAGQTTQQDVLKGQIELARLTEDLTTFRDLQQTVRERLNRTLNRAAGAPLGTPADFQVEEFRESLDSLYALALRNRPEIREADRAIARSEARESLAKWAFAPDFMVGAQYSIIDDTDLPGAPDPGQDALALGVGISIPLWIDRRTAALHESREMLRSARLAREQLDHDTRYEVADLFYRVRIAYRQVKLYEDSVLPQARQALEVSRTAYSAVPARVDFESLIDNYRRLLAFRLALARSRSDLQQRRAELERIVGGSLTEVRR